MRLKAALDRCPYVLLSVDTIYKINLTYIKTQCMSNDGKGTALMQGFYLPSGKLAYSKIEPRISKY